MKYFISGWAGFREALDVPQQWHFIVPFVDLDEAGILDFFKDKSGKTLIGWSTGGHIILKNFNFFSDRFDEIIVVAGFKKFTYYVQPRIIRRMIDKMRDNPEEVIREFLINAGIQPIIPASIDNDKLIKGLEFLISSEILNCPSEGATLTLIHGKSDKILPFKAVEDLKICFPLAKVYIVEKPHWICFNEILKIKASGCS